MVNRGSFKLEENDKDNNDETKSGYKQQYSNDDVLTTTKKVSLHSPQPVIILNNNKSTTCKSEGSDSSSLVACSATTLETNSTITSPIKSSLTFTKINSSTTKASLYCSLPLDRIRTVLNSLIQHAESTATTKVIDNEKCMCLYCDRSFTNVGLRQNHIYDTHSQQPSTSNRRKVTTVTKRERRRKQTPHLCLLLSNTPCLYCDKFNKLEHTLNDLFHHLIEKHSSKYFGCLQCEERFFTSCYLADHNNLKHIKNDDNDDNKQKIQLATATLTSLNSQIVEQPVAENEKSKPLKFTRSKLKTKNEIQSAPMSTAAEAATTTTAQNECDEKNKKEKKISAAAAKKITPKQVKSRNKRTQIDSKKEVGDKKRKERKLPNQTNSYNHNNKSASSDVLGSNSTKQIAEKMKPPSLPPPSCVNPYPEFDHFYRVKKITDHSIDNLKISSLTFDDVFDKAFFNRIMCNIEENLLHYIDGKLFKNEESENRISNFEKVSTPLSLEIQNSNLENYGCDLTLNAITPIATAVATLNPSQFGEDFEAQIEYGAKPSKKKPPTIKTDEIHYKYFTRRKYQASILQQKENRDLSKLDMWTQMVVKDRQEQIANSNRTAKEIEEYVSTPEYKNKMKRDELNRILDRRGPFEDLKEEASKKAAFDKLNLSATNGVIINEQDFSYVREIINEMLNRVFATISNEQAATNNARNHKETGALDDNYREIPSYLNLRRKDSSTQDEEIDQSDRIALICSSQDTENFELPTNSTRDKNELVELTGEWARSKMYICAACGAKFANMKYLLDHKNIYHQNVWVQHYEFVGNQSELYRHLSIPGLGKIGVIEETIFTKHWKRSVSRLCTKCLKQCHSLGELHRHVLECGGDWSWMVARKKCKYKPFGTKSRRKRKGLIQRTPNKQKTETPEKKQQPQQPYKRPVETPPRQKPSDAETIERMLANLPAKRSRRCLISLRDVVFKTRKYKRTTTVMNDKVTSTDNTSSVESNTPQNSSSIPTTNKSVVENQTQTKNKTCLRTSLNKVLSTATGRRRMLDPSLVIKRKKRIVNEKKSLSTKSMNNKATVRKRKVKQPIERKQLLPETPGKKRHILTNHLNIKRFFPVRKTKLVNLNKNHSANIETAPSKVRKVLRNNIDTDYQSNFQYLKKNKKGGLKGFVRALSTRKQNSRRENDHQVDSIYLDSEKIVQENKEIVVVDSTVSDTSKKATLLKIRKLPNTSTNNNFNNNNNKIKKNKDDASVDVDISFTTKKQQQPLIESKNSPRGNQGQPFLDETIMPATNIVSPAEVRENGHAKQDHVPIALISVCDTEENPLIPENIFDFSNNEEKSLQAKGDLDFENFHNMIIPEKAAMTVKSQLIVPQTIEDTKLLPVLVEKTPALDIPPPILRAPPTVQPSTPNTSKNGKIKKPKRLNDCIAMLTSKLQQHNEDKLSSSTESLFSVSSSTSGHISPAPSTSSICSQPKNECILKIPNFRKSPAPSILEHALDLSSKKSINDQSSENLISPISHASEENNLNKVIEGIIEYKCKELLNEKLVPTSSWPTIDFVDGYNFNKKCLNQLKLITRTNVDDTIDFVINSSTNWYDNINQKINERNHIKKSSSRKKKHSDDDNLIKDIIFGKDKLLIAPSSNLKHSTLIAKIKENDAKLYQEKIQLENNKVMHSLLDRQFNNVKSTENCILLNEQSKIEKAENQNASIEYQIPDNNESLSDKHQGGEEEEDDDDEIISTPLQCCQVVLITSEDEEENKEVILSDEQPSMQLVQNGLEHELPAVITIEEKNETTTLNQIENTEAISSDHLDDKIKNVVEDECGNNLEDKSEINDPIGPLNDERNLEETAVENRTETVDESAAINIQTTVAEYVIDAVIKKDDFDLKCNGKITINEEKLDKININEPPSPPLPPPKPAKRGRKKKSTPSNAKGSIKKNDVSKLEFEKLQSNLTEKGQDLDKNSSSNFDTSAPENLLKVPNEIKENDNLKMSITTQRARRKSKNSKKIENIENDLFKNFSLVINKKTKRIPPSKIVDDSMCDNDNTGVELARVDSKSGTIKENSFDGDLDDVDSVGEIDMDIEDIPFNSNIIERVEKEGVQNEEEAREENNTVNEPESGILTELNNDNKNIQCIKNSPFVEPVKNIDKKPIKIKKQHVKKQKLKKSNNLKMEKIEINNDNETSVEETVENKTILQLEKTNAEEHPPLIEIIPADEVNHKTNGNLINSGQQPALTVHNSNEILFDDIQFPEGTKYVSVELNRIKNINEHLEQYRNYEKLKKQQLLNEVEEIKTNGSVNAKIQHEDCNGDKEKDIELNKNKVMKKKRKTKMNKKNSLVTTDDQNNEIVMENSKKLKNQSTENEVKQTPMTIINPESSHVENVTIPAEIQTELPLKQPKTRGRKPKRLNGIINEKQSTPKQEPSSSSSSLPDGKLRRTRKIISYNEDDLEKNCLEKALVECQLLKEKHSKVTLVENIKLKNQLPVQESENEKKTEDNCDAKLIGNTDNCKGFSEENNVTIKLNENNAETEKLEKSLCASSVEKDNYRNTDLSMESSRLFLEESLPSQEQLKENKQEIDSDKNDNKIEEFSQENKIRLSKGKIMKKRKNNLKKLRTTLLMESQEKSSLIDHEATLFASIAPPQKETYFPIENEADNLINKESLDFSVLKNVFDNIPNSGRNNPLTDIIINSSEMDITPVLDEIDKSLEKSNDDDRIYDFIEKKDETIAHYLPKFKINNKIRNKNKNKQNNDEKIDNKKRTLAIPNRASRIAKVKALENIHELELDDKTINETKIRKKSIAEQPVVENQLIDNNHEEKIENYAREAETNNQLILVEPESIVNSVLEPEKSDTKTNEEIEQKIRKKPIQEKQTENQELRRSSRGSRKVASYNENDLIDPLIDALENRRYRNMIKKDKLATENKNIKKTSDSFTDQKSPIRKAPVENNLFTFDLMIDDKIKDIDKIYEFTEESGDSTEEMRELFSKNKKRSFVDKSADTSIANELFINKKPEEHEQEKSNYCEICKKSFIRIENLIKHKTTLTHISKLSELEAKAAEEEREKLKSTANIENTDSTLKIAEEQEEEEETQPVIYEESKELLKPSSLNLVDIISDVLNKPANFIPDKCTYSEFPPLPLLPPPLPPAPPPPPPLPAISPTLSINDAPYKNLAERKSFECDNPIITINNDDDTLAPISDNFLPSTISKTTLLENQINLLENIIGSKIESERKTETEQDKDEEENDEQDEEIGNAFIEVSSRSSSRSSCNVSINSVHYSYISSRSTSFNLSTEQNQSNDVHFIKPTQYEEISDDSIIINAREDSSKQIRKTLNRDEELFLECCSLLKSGSEISNSNYPKKSTTNCRLERHCTNNSKWYQKNSNNTLMQRPEDIAHEYSDNSRTPTPLGDTYDDNASNSNTISSNWNLQSEKSLTENRSLSFEQVISKEENDSAVEMSFGEMLTQGLKNQFNDCTRKIENRHNHSLPDEKKDDSDSSTTSNNKKIITKGARKVFESLKISIPTEQINLDLLNRENKGQIKKNVDETKPDKASLTPKISEEPSTPTTVVTPSTRLKSTRKSKPVKKSQIGNNLFFKVNKKKSFLQSTTICNDVDDNDVKQEKTINLMTEKIRNNTDLFQTFKNNENNGILSDNDSADYTDSIGADAKSLSTVSSFSTFSLKKQQQQEPEPPAPPEQNITKKKCMIMGKIFKNAAKSKFDEKIDEEFRHIADIPEMDNFEMVENYVRNCHRDSNMSPLPAPPPPPAAAEASVPILSEEPPKKAKMTEEEMNILFDKLLGKKIEEPPPLPPSRSSPLPIKSRKYRVKNRNKNGEVKRRIGRPKNSKKRTRDESESSEDEFGLNQKIKTRKRYKKRNNDDSGINLELELKECIGVASRKSQRKCTSGKQNVLAEYWSSDEEAFEAMLESQRIHRNEELEKHKKRTTSSNKNTSLSPDHQLNQSTNLVLQLPRQLPAAYCKRKLKSIKKSAKMSTIQQPMSHIHHTTRGGAVRFTTIGRRKRAAANPLYHWSSSSEDESQSLIEVKPIREEDDDDDDDNRPMQHGWIVGDSPKKLVTMLALTKGKKNDIISVKEQNKRRVSNIS